MAKVYGIDLGTTYSVITTLDNNNNPIIITNTDDSSELLASAVYFPEDGDPVVGVEAKNQKEAEPERVVEFVKRFIGKEDAPTYEFNGIKYDPITISSLILKRMKAYADAQGENVQNVVITCPAYFGASEKAATKAAGEIAGLNVMNIVHEPVAAALNYCSKEFNENRRIMVYDLGGGTFDITLFDFTVDENGKTVIDVIKTGGDDRLGGIDWDARMFDYMCEKYSDEVGISVSELDEETRNVIKSLVEQSKRNLSQLPSKRVTIRTSSDKQAIDLSREEFEEKTKDLVERTMDFVHQLLSDSNCTSNDVDLVLLVGGSTLMPMIKNAVESLFPGKVRVEEPNLAVAKGAALSAATEWNEIMHQIIDGKKPEHVALPGITPDKAKGEIIPNVSDNEVRDRLSRSVGPAVFISENEYMIDNLMFEGDLIPAEAESTYGTRVANAEEIVVNVFENVSKEKYVTPSVNHRGESQYTDPALKVRAIGEVHLKLPPQTPKGSPIRVVFRSSTVGLEVTAENVTTGESVNAIIEDDKSYTQEQTEEAKKQMETIKPRAEI